MSKKSTSLSETDRNKKKSSLKVQKGIEQPSSFNPNLNQLKNTKVENKDVEYYVKGIKSGNRTILSKAITLVESSLPDHHKIAQLVIEKCLPYSGMSIRIGITGVPGVGKSTFIEVMGKHLTDKGHKLAVLAIDPSSQRTKGSILGDKTRMEELAKDKNAFIRPSPSAGTLGGVARKTKEIIILCEAAGFDTIIVETVGVGQSETSVHSMVDFFLLLVLAGAGDELQGIKRGIMELANAIIINKADGDNQNKANIARQEYQNALHLFPPDESGWIPPVETCSARDNKGIEKVIKIISAYKSLMIKNNYFYRKRQEQELKIMFETLRDSFREQFENNGVIKNQIEKIKENVLDGKISAYKAANQLLSTYYGSLKRET